VSTKKLVIFHTAACHQATPICNPRHRNRLLINIRQKPVDSVCNTWFTKTNVHTMNFNWGEESCMGDSALRGHGYLTAASAMNVRDFSNRPGSSPAT
jgi:hypothetical protein